MADDKQLLELVAAASSDIHGVGNACMFRDQCRAMAARIAELEAALRPFAKFYPSLIEWRSVRGYRQDAYPNHTPVVAGAYPANDETSHVCQLWVSDFKRAAAALGEGVGG